MKIWHLTSDTPRSPFKVNPGQKIHMYIGTWPIESLYRRHLWKSIVIQAR